MLECFELEDAAKAEGIHWNSDLDGHLKTIIQIVSCQRKGAIDDIIGKLGRTDNWVILWLHVLELGSHRTSRQVLETQQRNRQTVSAHDGNYRTASSVCKTHFDTACLDINSAVLLSDSVRCSSRPLSGKRDGHCRVGNDNNNGSNMGRLFYNLALQPVCFWKLTPLTFASRR